MSQLMDAALDLLSHGFSVFPLEPRDKIPNWKLLPQKVNEAGELVWVDAKGEETTENTGKKKHTWLPFAEERPTARQVIDWWTTEPEANIGIACGPVSGCFVLDIDGDEGIAELKKREKMPDTVTNRSGKPSGWHLFFLYPDFTVSNKSPLLPGLDIRGYHGYIVAPPSIHPNGKAYRSVKGFKDTSLSEAPEWLLSLLRPEPRPIMRHSIRDYPHNPSEDYDLAKRALDAIHTAHADNYDDWIKVGMSLRPLGESGLQLWESWSAQSSKNRERDCSKRWGGFRGTTLGILFKMANEDYGGNTWRPLRPTALDTRKRDRVQEIIEETWTSLPVAVRAALNIYAPAGVGAVLELWIEGQTAGLIQEGDPVTVRCLEHVSKTLHRNVRRQMIERALNQDVVQFCTNLSLYESSIEDTDTGSDSHARSQEGKECEGTDSDPCSPRAGRKAVQYHLLPQDTILENLAQLAVVPILEKHFPAKGELAAPIRAEFLSDLGCADADDVADELDEKYGAAIQQQTGFQRAMNQARRALRQLRFSLEHPTYAPIPPDRSYGKAGEYVTECVKAVFRSSGGVLRLSKTKLAALFGCSDRNLLTVLRRAKVWVLKDQFVESGPVTLETLETTAKAPKQWDKTYQGYPLAAWSSTCDWTYNISRANLMTWARTEHKNGAELRIRYSQANLTFLPGFELRKRWTLALLKALCPVVEPEQATQQELFPEPEPEAVKVPVKPRRWCFELWKRLILALLDALVVKPEPPAPVEKLTYAEQWFEKVVQVGTAALKVDYNVHLVGPEKPQIIQQSLDLLLYGVRPETPDIPVAPTPCPDSRPVMIWFESAWQAWLELRAYFEHLLAQCVPIRSVPLLLLPASCGP